MHGSNYKNENPDGDKALTELRENLLAEVTSNDVRSEITELARELGAKLEDRVKSTLFETRRPQK